MPVTRLALHPADIIREDTYGFDYDADGPSEKDATPLGKCKLRNIEMYNLCQTISKHDTIFSFCVNICWICEIFYMLRVQHLPQKRHLPSMDPTKCQGQNDRMGRTVTLYVCYNLVFTIGFAIQISIFTLPLLLRFFCLINSFYRRYDSCVYIFDPI